MNKKFISAFLATAMTLSQILPLTVATTVDYQKNSSEFHDSIAVAVESEFPDEGALSSGAAVDNAPVESESPDEDTSSDNNDEEDTLTSYGFPLYQIGKDAVEVTIWYNANDRTVPYVDMNLLESLCPNMGFHFEDHRLTSSVVSGFVYFDVEHNSFTQHQFALTQVVVGNSSLPLLSIVGVQNTEGSDAVVNLDKSGYRIVEQNGSILVPVVVST